MSCNQFLRNTTLIFLGVSLPAMAFEDTRVMPKGIRSIRFITLTSSVSEKTDAAGVASPLAKPLERSLTFNDIVKGEKDPLRRSLLNGFFEYGSFSSSDSVGQFKGDIQSRVTALAPVVMFGATDRLTIVAALPIVNAAVGVNLGFQANATGQRFLNTLSDSYNNQVSAAREAGEKINGAVSQLNKKLVDNGYAPATNWSATGLGDLNLVGKYRVFSSPGFASALTGAVVVPTGRKDDPNNLLDKNFGDGQWDLAGTLAFDEPIATSGATLSQFVKYTYQMPGKKSVRMATEAEELEVPVREVEFKLADKVEAGTSVSYSTDLGVNGGVGYSFYTKGKDSYKAGASSSKLSAETNERSHEASIEIGYTSIPAFLRKEVLVPFDTKFVYKRQLSSVNMPVTNFFQLETALFF